MYHRFFLTHPLTEGHLGCFQFLPVTNKIYKINTHVAIRIYAFFSVIKVSKRWNGYYMTVINFLFKKLPNCFPECIFTISRSILGMISLLSISHSNRPICIVILTCISQMTNDIKHLLKSLFCSIFFAEVICSTILPGASLRNSAHGKGHEEGGLAYTKA